MKTLSAWVLVCWSVLATAAPPRILVLGDSLSAGYGVPTGRGWVYLLEERLGRKELAWQVVNASVSGDTSRGALSRLPQALERHRPAVVIVELGGNDGLRGLPLAALRENLTVIVRRVQEAGARVLLAGMRLPPNYGPDYTAGFRRVYEEVAREEGVPLVPFILAGVAEDPELMQEDGIHPRAEAQERILDNVWPQLRPLLDGP